MYTERMGELGKGEYNNKYNNKARGSDLGRAQSAVAISALLSFLFFSDCSPSKFCNGLVHTQNLLAVGQAE